MSLDIVADSSSGHVIGSGDVGRKQPQLPAQSKATTGGKEEGKDKGGNIEIPGLGAEGTKLGAKESAWQDK